MLQYILECISFQLIFLIIYDFFLKKETFFQWNRLYLLGTHILSLILPWVKIEAFKTEVPTEYFVYPEFLWDMDSAPITVTANENSILNISWQQGVFFLGLLGATLLFGYKMHQLYRLRKNGDVHYFSNFTRIIVTNSNLAFSFFKSIFLGDKVLTKEHENIIKHELVHIQQKHSWDLLFFELLRIVFWFNPLVYVYQSRVSELHEFIADAHMAKTNKKEQYQLLLSQVFQTQHISFVNQFFKTSLIKKRIAMLQKTKSKKIWRLKYLLLVPMVVGMLFYTSVAQEPRIDHVPMQETSNDASLIREITEKIEDDISRFGDVGMAFYVFNTEHTYPSTDVIFTKNEFFEYRILSKMSFTHMWEEVIGKGGNMGEIAKRNLSYINKTPVLSTAMYESYVNRKKAFQIMDDNLGVSINAYKQEVVMIASDEINTDNTFVVQVADISDLTGIELKAFNNRSEEIFEQQESEFTSLVIRDTQHAFRVFSKTEPANDARNIIREYYTFSDRSKTQDPPQPNSDKDDDVVPFNLVGQVPVFPGCEEDDEQRGCFYENIREHIRKNFRYPEEAQQREIEGVVKVMFLIDQNGDIKHIRTMGKEQLLTDESRRIISLLPSMQPGSHQGKLVNVPFSIPITFKLVSENVAQNPKLQNVQNNLDVPFAVADEIPIFPGCEGESDSKGCFQEMLQKHISKHFRYPEEAQLLGIKGRVSIMFTIDKNGDITDIRKRGPHKLLEAEAERIITLLPKMTPGKHDGKTVNIPFSIPITFKLEGDDSNSTENISSYDYELLPSNIRGADLKLKKTVTNYNQLALERKRLLLKSNEKNPIIVNLDKQLRAMANQIYASGLYGSIAIPFAVVDEVPVYLGCEGDDDKRGCFQEKIIEHIRKNFRYPEEAQKQEIQGRVEVKFVMDKAGNITSIYTRGPHKLLKNEAERIIGLMPSVKPGVHKGKVANVSFSIPITFKLQGDSNDSSEKIDIRGTQGLQDMKKEDFPLVFIDGKESTQVEVYELQKNNLIKSISVIKDKNKLIMYGAKGKNGVIKVNTKKLDLETMSVSAYTKIEGHKKYISGKVTDGSGGLPGVNIIVQGVNRAVVSNFDGEFTIEVQKGDVITFQYIGLPTAALTVTDQEKYLVTASE